MNNSNFAEWSREEKDQYAEKRMKEMALKNAELKRRYDEVLKDRMVAERKDSAITKDLRKEKNSSSYEGSKSEKSTEYTREWDRGKSDKNNWRSPDRQGSFKSYRSGHYGKRDDDRRDKWGSNSRNDDDSWNDCKSTARYSKRDGDRRDKWGSRNDEDSWNDYKAAGHFDRKDSFKKDKWSNYSRNNEDSWNDYKSVGHHERKFNDKRENNNSYSRNETGDQYWHDGASDNRKPKGNYRYKHDNDQHNSSYFNRSPKRLKGVEYQNAESHKKLLQLSDEKCRKPDFNQMSSRKKYFHRDHSKSSSRSDSDRIDDSMQICVPPKLNELTLWENCKYNEDLVKKNKQDRVKTWIESVNKSNKYLEKNASEKVKDDTKPYSKFDKYECPSNDADLNVNDNISESNSPKETNYKKNQNSTSEKSNYRKNTKLYPKFEHPSNEEDSDANDNIPESSSPEDNKYKRNRDSAAEKLNYYENEGQNKKLSSYNAGYNPVRQNIDVRRRGGKTKHIETYSSRSGKNEHFVKHGKLDNVDSGDGKCSMPVNENRKTRYAGKNKFCKKNPNWDNDNTWTKQTQAADHWGMNDQSPIDDDGKWGSAEQSISWQISDEEGDANKKNVYKEYPAGDTWDDYDDNQQTYSQNENQSIVSKEQPAIIVAGGDTRIRHNDSQVKISSKFADRSSKDKMKCNVRGNKSKVDGWKNHSSTDFPDILNEICEKMDENCKIDERGKSNVGNTAERDYSEGEVVSSDDEKQA